MHPLPRVKNVCGLHDCGRVRGRVEAGTQKALLKNKKLQICIAEKRRQNRDLNWTLCQSRNNLAHSSLKRVESHLLYLECADPE